VTHQSQLVDSDRTRMDSEDTRRFIYTRTGASHRDFIEFWAPRYHDAHERLYTNNIRGPRTDSTLRDLFYWKEGPQFFNDKWPSMNANFISKRQQASGLPQDISGEDFLMAFPDGGRIYRIFWLHCWHPDRFPIYDQHVHRAMTCIQDGESEELERYSDAKVIESYLTRYIAFHQQYASIKLSFDPTLDGIPTRKADRALFTFGKSLPKSGMPKLRAAGP
jgi:hypothetical protein